MNILLEAREIVRNQPPTPAVSQLRGAADAFDTAYRALRLRCTRENITDFVARSTHLLIAIENIHTASSPPPTAGAARESRKQAA